MPEGKIGMGRMTLIRHPLYRDSVVPVQGGPLARPKKKGIHTPFLPSEGLLPPDFRIIRARPTEEVKQWQKITPEVRRT